MEPKELSVLIKDLETKTQERTGKYTEPEAWSLPFDDFRYGNLLMLLCHIAKMQETLKKLAKK